MLLNESGYIFRFRIATIFLEFSHNVDIAFKPRGRELKKTWISRDSP